MPRRDRAAVGFLGGLKLEDVPNPARIILAYERPEINRFRGRDVVFTAVLKFKLGLDHRRKCVGLVAIVRTFHAPKAAPK